MAESDETIAINVTLDISVETLKTIVENAKKIAGTDAKGIYRVDTAEKVNEMVSGFLKTRGFDAYVKDIHNYRAS